MSTILTTLKANHLIHIIVHAEQQVCRKSILIFALDKFRKNSFIQIKMY